MSQEDIVQIQNIKYVDFSIAGGVLTINHQAGFGVFTRTGVGTFNLALVSNPSAVPPRPGSYRAPIPAKLLDANFTQKGGANSVYSYVDSFDILNTPNNLVVHLVNANGGALVDANGCFTFSQCENFTQASK